MDDIFSQLDYTLLSPEAGESAVVAMTREAVARGYGSVCVAPVWVRRVAHEVGGRGVRVGSVAGFPLGMNKPTLKAIEATAAIKDGADRIDVVAFLPNLLAGDVDAAKLELMEVVRGARASRRDVIITVIVEAGLLLGGGEGERRIAEACRAVRQSGADVISTGGGFYPAAPASAEAVRLLKKHAEGLVVKAAGGIGDLGSARELLAAGADRVALDAAGAKLEEARGRT